MVFQFPFFDRWKFSKQMDFLAVLAVFLKKLPAERRFAVEIRNKNWLDARLADLLREHKIALVLQDLSHMPGPVELSKKFDPITADWTYIRWLGDRKAIEKQTTTWNKTVVDRTTELSSWVDYCYQIRKRGVLIYGYANNHGWATYKWKSRRPAFLPVVFKLAIQMTAAESQDRVGSSNGPEHS
jgi:uncharacterized protein YecE (DUF72 family)